MPAPEALIILLFSFGVLAFCFAGMCAPDKTLVGLAHIIGTKNPKVSRIACIVGVVFGALGTLSAGAMLLGLLDSHD
jgi:hypothetical protein